MKVTIEIDWTPQEARAFFGQPDLEPFNTWLVDEMKTRYARNLDAMRPEEVMKSWMSFGGQATEHLRRIMETASSQAPRGE